jgi:glycerate dehydrogenase
VLATGTNVVDLAAAREQGVVVSNVPAYSTASVAEHTFALLFALNNRIAEHNSAARDGRWSRSGHFSFPLGPIEELHGQCFGIVGLGTIGRNVAQIARAFGMRVVAAQSASAVNATRDAELGVTRLTLDELLATADVVSLHCPLNEHTRGLVDARRLRLMKPSAVLLNTSRGPVIDEAALAEALGRGQLRGAGLDVLSQEPPAPDHPLLRASNCVVTPHLAWATVQARTRLLSVSVDNVRAFLAGAPQNVVSVG